MSGVDSLDIQYRQICSGGAESRILEGVVRIEGEFNSLDTTRIWFEGKNNELISVQFPILNGRIEIEAVA